MVADDNRRMNDTIGIQGSVQLDHWGVIRAIGPDARQFLQGQLTNDVSQLTPGQARLAGFCSAKGRLQASFVVWQAGADEFLLACAASVLPATLKRLSMFVLRAKCKLMDAGTDLRVWGAAGDTATALVGGCEVWQQRDADGASAIRLPDVDGVARALWLRPTNAAAVPGTGLALDAWRWLEVRSGVPIVETATVDQFVPQMLNYELLGGVDFRKGCYPGQEVVARSQYRGTIKRRMFLFETDAAPSTGQEIFHSADPGQPAGLIVNAAAAPAGNRFSALAEVKLAALEAGTLHLGTPDGPLLRRIDLPYAMPLDAAEATA